MGKKLPPEQLAFYKRIDELLWHDWDPCSAGGAPEARDEYHGYLPGVFELAMAGGTKHEIARRLMSIERERMGLHGDKRRCTAVAERIVAAREELLG
jgi:hypothetical protein